MNTTRKPENGSLCRTLRVAEIIFTLQLYETECTRWEEGNLLYSNSKSDSLGFPVKEVDVYDFKLKKWLVTNRPDDLPTPRSGAAVAVFDGKIMLMGGESSTQTKAYTQVDELDPATGKWSTLTPMYHARHGTQAVVSGQGVYVIAGSPVQREGRPKKNGSVQQKLSYWLSQYCWRTFRAKSGRCTIRQMHSHYSACGRQRRHFRVVDYTDGCSEVELPILG
jgi:hypothetical protein